MSQEMPTPGNPEQNEGDITRESVVEAFRALKSGGVENPDDLENPEVKEAIEMLDAFAEQKIKAAKESGDGEGEARANLERTTILLDAGFDASKNSEWLDERSEWLIRDYDEAIGNGLGALAQEILTNIHRVDDLLGREHFNPEEMEEIKPLPDAFLSREEREKRLVDLYQERVKTSAQKALESPENDELREGLRRLLSGDLVRALTNHYTSRGYRDEAREQAHTFIKITDAIVIYGQGDMRNFGFDSVRVLTVEASRPLVNEMENNPGLIKEHK